MNDSLDEKFTQASKKVTQLKARPTNEELLNLYALFKQATEGDVSGKRPGMLDIKGRKKYDAWAGVQGLAAAQAKEKYANLVESLVQKYG